MPDFKWKHAAIGASSLAVALASFALAGSVQAQTGFPARIKVGSLTGLTGPGAGAAFSTITGIRVGIKDINDAGGILGHPVDLVTEKALRPQLRPFIEKEAVIV